jgi:hypothetical protein
MPSPTTFPYGPGQTQDNITALPVGQAKVLGQLGVANTPLYDIVISPIQVMTGAGAVGTIDLYLVCSETPGAGGNWEGGVNPTLATDQSAMVSQLRRVKTVNVIASAATYKFDEWSLASVLGFMPMFATVMIMNNTNAAFNATSTNFIAQYSQVNYTSPAPISYN